jgi:protein-S-isoprenylcysteine O-methyltransferase Ste14
MNVADDWSIQLPGRPWWFRWRGRFGGIVIVAAVALILISVPTVVEDSWLDEALDAAGWAVFLIGAALRLWATLYIGGRKDWTLVSQGPYSICRNPLYLGSCLMLLSFAFFLDSVLILVVLAAVIFAYVATVRAEERMLRKTLGQEYERYCQRVPRFWPRPSQFHTPEAIEVRVKGLRIECMRMARWLLIPLSMEIVSHLREYPWWPHLLRLP